MRRQKVVLDKIRICLLSVYILSWLFVKIFCTLQVSWLVWTITDDCVKAWHVKSELYKFLVKIVPSFLYFTVAILKAVPVSVFFIGGAWVVELKAEKKRQLEALTKRKKYREKQFNAHRDVTKFTCSYLVSFFFLLCLCCFVKSDYKGNTILFL